MSSRSVASWIGEFNTTRARIVPVPEDASVDELVAVVLDLPGDHGVALHSSHRSLWRDAVTASVLRRDHDRTIFAQTEKAAAAGADKAIVHRELERCEIPHTARTTELRPTAPVIFKRRAGTEGRDMRLEWTGAAPSELEVAEEFTFGEEFSVNLFVDDRTCVTLPPVWKGATRLDLVPPWRRARICPYPYMRQALDDGLRQMAIGAARACGAVGFVEVEFVVESATGRALVLEVNPRISGTLRMSAMASGAKLLDLFEFRRPVRFDAVGVAIEVPYHGEPFSDMADGVIATSRLTVVGKDLAEAESRLATFGGQDG